MKNFKNLIKNILKVVFQASWQVAGKDIWMLSGIPHIILCRHSPLKAAAHRSFLLPGLWSTQKVLSPGWGLAVRGSSPQPNSLLSFSFQITFFWSGSIVLLFEAKALPHVGSVYTRPSSWPGRAEAVSQGHTWCPACYNCMGETVLEFTGIERNLSNWTFGSPVLRPFHFRTQWAFKML